MSSDAVSEVFSKTGKTLIDFKILVDTKGLIEESEIYHWLKSHFELEHGHATTISRLIMPAQLSHPHDALTKRHFAGPKADWLPAYSELVSKLRHFGSDVIIENQSASINFKRSEVMFGLLEVQSQRLLIGLNLPDAPTDSKFTAAGIWHPPMTHRVEISLQQQINDELVSWLRAAYKLAS